MNDKAAIYIRVSTHWQVDKDSLQVQRRELTAYCEMILGISDLEVFEDAGYSAKNTDRPAYQQMISRIRTGEFSHLVVWKIDRISRNIIDFASMYSELKSLGVVFVSKNEKFDTSSAIGEAMLKIILVFAELERNMTAERVTAVMLSRATNGDWNGGRVPYGYTYNKETKKFTVNEEEYEHYKYIVKSYISGKSLQWIVNSLNQSGIKSRKGNLWTATSVRKALVNEFYLGTYTYNKRSNGELKKESDWIKIKDHHIALIDENTFAHINRQLNANRRGVVRAGDTYVRKNIHLYSGLTRCSKCGGNMFAVVHKQSNRSVYSCSLKRKDPKACNNKSISDSGISPVLFYLTGRVIAARDYISEDTKTEDFKRFLIGKEIFDIPSEDVEKLMNHIKSVSSYSAYKPTEIFDKPTSDDEYAMLDDRRRKLENALSRLKAAYLFSENGIPEVEFIVEQKKLVDELNQVNMMIENVQSNELDMESIEQQATFKIMMNQLMKQDSNFERFLEIAEKTVPKKFFASIYESIYSEDGVVRKLVFRNGITIRINYK